MSDTNSGDGRDLARTNVVQELLAEVADDDEAVVTELETSEEKEVGQGGVVQSETKQYVGVIRTPDTDLEFSLTKHHDK